jgi:hypothetical protein
MQQSHDHNFQERAMAAVGMNPSQTDSTSGQRWQDFSTAASAPSGSDIVDQHTVGTRTDVKAVAQELKAQIQARPDEATTLTKEALDHVSVDDRDELAQEFVREHSDAELQALGQTDAGKGALALSLNELASGSIYGDEADDANRIGRALGVESDVQANAGWSVISGAVHTVLDVAGFIPGLGAVPDLINAGIYAAEGDYKNAALSATAAIPLAGDAVKGTTMAVKGGRELLEAGAEQAVRHGDDIAGAAAKKADDVVDAVPPAGPPGGAAKTGDGAMPEGLAYRTDLPQHLAGPHGFKGAQLHGTHNVDNAVAELNSRGISHRLEPTGTAGISEMKYDVVKPDGTVRTYSKTVYDPNLFSDSKMLDMAQSAGEKAFAAFKQNPSGPSTFEFVEDGVKMRAYINKTPEGTPFVGNVHPVN